MTIDPTTAIRANYTRGAVAYNGAWAESLAVHSRALADALPLLPTRRIIELGCGPGRLLPYLRESAPSARIVGADLTEAMVRLARPEFARLTADIASLPFTAGSFDAALLPFMLFHVPDLPRALDEVHRILGPGGLFGATTWHQQDPHTAYAVWMRLVDETGAPADPAPQMPSGGTTSDPDLLAQALDRAGFDDVEVSRRRFVHRQDAETFLTHLSGIGRAARRLDLLGPDERQAFLTMARQELNRLPAEDFVETGWLLQTTARRRHRYLDRNGD